ncbi:hypothetical protein SNEBB_002216 [Seison nebaliae]|nr:hypothetical protein SNEBB_002216 [Seison nebaliae]
MVYITVDSLLWCISLVYGFAFSSIYHQLPGLFGDNGILPVKHLNWENFTLKQFWKTPTLILYLSNTYRLLTPYQYLDIFVLFGVVISTLSLLINQLRCRMIFFILWLLYLSVYYVGQTFLSFQWDILLLESGFLTIFLADWTSNSSDNRPHQQIIIYLMRWLFFRLMYASGIVKLKSQCPAWWNLSAMDWHYQSQCIPSKLAWNVHFFNESFHHLSTVLVYYIEIVLPFLIFSPFYLHRVICMWSQIVLMILIILTGNYNFFNILTIILSLSLLNFDSGNNHLFISNRKLLMIINYSSLLIFLTITLYLTKNYFNITNLTSITKIDTKINFTQEQFTKFTSISLNLSLVLSVIWFAYYCLYHFYITFAELSFSIENGFRVMNNLFVFIMAIFIFLMTLIPYSAINNRPLPVVSTKIYKTYMNVAPFHIARSYGLFRRMTGVGGRPEIIVEGTNENLEILPITPREDDEPREYEWKEYHFKYKPGDVNRKLPFLIPHQPRLDWQMWFAALSSYAHNQWLINFCHRILHNPSDVMPLLDGDPFKNDTFGPKWIRINYYTYYFNKNSNEQDLKDSSNFDKDNGIWWKRKFERKYLFSLQKNGDMMKMFGKQYKLESDEKRIEHHWLRRLISKTDPQFFTLQPLITFSVVKLLNQLIY